MDYMKKIQKLAGGCRYQTKAFQQLEAMKQESISVLFNHIKKEINVHENKDLVKALLIEIGRELIKQGQRSGIS